MKLRMRSALVAVCMMVCLVFVSVVSPETVSAKKLTTIAQAKKEALKKVPGATVTEVDKDYENGILVYEVELVKGTKEYSITYRASDGKILSYGWEDHNVNRTSKKKIMSKSAIKSLAKKKVKNATVVSTVKTKDDGVDVYKVKLKTSTKKYTLEYHARTGKLLEYEWDLIKKSSTKDTSEKYIGATKAKQIALKKVPGATVIKVEFDMDDGVPLYDVDLIKGNYEYEIQIHAKTGKILDFEKERL